MQEDSYKKGIKIPIRPVVCSEDILQEFSNHAWTNFVEGLDTIGLLCGKCQGDSLVVTHLVIPNQEEVNPICLLSSKNRLNDAIKISLFEETTKRFAWIKDKKLKQCLQENDLQIFGWIHGHFAMPPFMSDADVVQHCLFGLGEHFGCHLEEAVAVVTVLDQYGGGYFNVFSMTNSGIQRTIKIIQQPTKPFTSIDTNLWRPWYEEYETAEHCLMQYAKQNNAPETTDLRRITDVSVEPKNRLYRKDWEQSFLPDPRIEEEQEDSRKMITGQEVLDLFENLRDEEDQQEHEEWDARLQETILDPIFEIWKQIDELKDPDKRAKWLAGHHLRDKIYINYVSQILGKDSQGTSEQSSCLDEENQETSIPSISKDESHGTGVIEKNFEYLVEHIKCEATELGSILTEKNVISGSDMEDIMQMSKTGRDLNRNLLNFVRKRPMEHLHYFLEALCETWHGHVVKRLIADENLKKDILKTSPKAVLKLQKKICQRLKGYLDRVTVLSIKEEAYEVDMKQIYVPIHQTILINLPSKKIVRVVNNYGEIFDDSLKAGTDSTTCILVKGEALSGKSTFMRKLVHDWMQVKRDESHEQESTCFHQYKIILPLAFGRVPPDQSIKEIIKNQLHLEDEDMDCIQKLCADTPSKVLFILDGLDESDSSNKLFDVMKGTVFQGVTVLVTSREEGLGIIHGWNYEVEVELQSLDLEQMKKFTLLYFNGNEEQCEHLMDEINDSSELFTFATNPGRLAILCLLWKDKEESSSEESLSELEEPFSRCLSHLFQDFVCFLFKLGEKKLKLEKRYTNYTDIFNKNKDLLTKFGKVASKHQRGVLCVRYSAAEIMKEVNKDALSYGFFLQYDVKDPFKEKEVYFIHRSVQEWLAAFYLVETKGTLSLPKYRFPNDSIQDSLFHSFGVSLMNKYAGMTDFTFWVLYFRKLLQKHPIHVVHTNIAWYYREVATLLIPEGKMSKMKSEQDEKYKDYRLKCKEVSSEANYHRMQRAMQNLNVPVKMKKLGIGQAIVHILLMLPNCQVLDLRNSQGTFGTNEMRHLVTTAKKFSLKITHLYLDVTDFVAVGIHGDKFLYTGYLIGRLIMNLPYCTMLHLGQCMGANLQRMLDTLAETHVKIKHLVLGTNFIHMYGDKDFGAAIGNAILKFSTCTRLELYGTRLLEPNIFEDVVNSLEDKQVQIELMCIRYNQHQFEMPMPKIYKIHHVSIVETLLKVLQRMPHLRCCFLQGYEEQLEGVHPMCTSNEEKWNAACKTWLEDKPEIMRRVEDLYKSVSKLEKMIPTSEDDESTSYHEKVEDFCKSLSKFEKMLATSEDDESTSNHEKDEKHMSDDTNKESESNKEEDAAIEQRKRRLESKLPIPCTWGKFAKCKECKCQGEANSTPEAEDANGHLIDPEKSEQVEKVCFALDEADMELIDEIERNCGFLVGQKQKIRKRQAFRIDDSRTEAEKQNEKITQEAKEVENTLGKQQAEKEDVSDRKPEAKSEKANNCSYGDDVNQAKSSLSASKDSSEGNEESSNDKV